MTLKKKEKTNTMKIFTELSGSESGPQVKKELEMESRLLWLKLGFEPATIWFQVEDSQASLKICVCLLAFRIMFVHPVFVGILQLKPWGSSSVC